MTTSHSIDPCAVTRKGVCKRERGGEKKDVSCTLTGTARHPSHPACEVHIVASCHNRGKQADLPLSVLAFRICSSKMPALKLLRKSDTILERPPQRTR